MLITDKPSTESVDDASLMDIYLQPHSDDICFSLGSFAHKRHCGVLLTAFSISRYVPLRQGVAPPAAELVTRTRIAEDMSFAAACGLSTRILDMPDASFLGHHPFDLGWVDENLQRIESPLLNALLDQAADRGSSMRPWFFCPSGIGGHVDHVAIRMAVERKYDQLAPFYRIGFYEDLYYASDQKARRVGLSRLFQGIKGRKLRRYIMPVANDVAAKLALIELYRSQFLEVPRAIDRFTPADETSTAPHEAIWSEEMKGPVPLILA